ncbi:MAG: GNAT family N-acetyltransferase [Coriobacteriales bacterium]|jgi:predicted acetyltransferase|nr:GNAT family N-acetyltransferase [Coriobacteriales bacterium]
MEMQLLALVQPSEKHETLVMDYRRELLDAGENVIHGAPLLEEFEDYSQWLRLARCDFSVSPKTKGWVDATTLLALSERGDRMVGIVNIRHELTEYLQKFGGHIGFSVCPSERRRGYASDILLQALDYCKQELGIAEIMANCYADNEASRRTIVKCGGVLECERLYEDGKPMQVYWIKLGDAPAS